MRRRTGNKRGLSFDSGMVKGADMTTRSITIAAFIALVFLSGNGRVLLAAPPEKAPATKPGDGPDKHVVDNETVRKALEKPLPEVTVDGVGFSDVIDFLRDVTRANIEVDWGALEAAGIDRNVPVTARLVNVKFSKVLAVVLKFAHADKDELDYVVEDGGIMISTRSDLGTKTVKKTLDVSALIAGPKGAAQGPEAAARREAALIKTIAVSVDPRTWKANGGNAGELEIKDGKLTVTATEENQKVIATLLEQLSELLK